MSNLSLTDSSKSKHMTSKNSRGNKDRESDSFSIVYGIEWDRLCSSSQMQRLQGNALKEKDLKPSRSITEARSILYRDTNNAAGAFTSLT
ncbi:hypothetical protein Tco_0085939, partial [Tanacetum coccineum]